MGGVRYARVMGGVFKPGVQLPPKGLLMQYERARLAALVLSLCRIVTAPEKSTLPPLPYEIIIELVRATILTTPQYGIDPVHFFQWFWNRPPALDLVTRINDPLPESPVQREPRDPEDGHKFVGHGRYLWGYRHWGIRSYPQRMPLPRDPADVPAMTWRDLSAVYIEYIAGSSMIHRMIDDTHKGAEGTATWYPDDIDIFVWSDHTVVRTHVPSRCFRTVSDSHLVAGPFRAVALLGLPTRRLRRRHHHL